MIRNIEEIGNFYLVNSIGTGEKSDISFTDDSRGLSNLSGQVFSFPKKSNIDRLDILTMKEELNQNSFSHHSIAGDVSFIYNRRLHLANIRNTMFKGFGFENFGMIRKDSYNYNGYPFNDSYFGDKKYKFDHTPGFPYVIISCYANLNK